MKRMEARAKKGDVTQGSQLASRQKKLFRVGQERTDTGAKWNTLRHGYRPGSLQNTAGTWVDDKKEATRLTERKEKTIVFEFLEPTPIGRSFARSQQLRSLFDRQFAHSRLPVSLFDVMLRSGVSGTVLSLKKVAFGYPKVASASDSKSAAASTNKKEEEESTTYSALDGSEKEAEAEADAGSKEEEEEEEADAQPQKTFRTSGGEDGSGSGSSGGGKKLMSVSINIKPVVRKSTAQAEAEKLKHVNVLFRDVNMDIDLKSRICVLGMWLCFDARLRLCGALHLMSLMCLIALDRVCTVCVQAITATAKLRCSTF